MAENKTAGSKQEREKRRTLLITCHFEVQGFTIPGCEANLDEVCPSKLFLVLLLSSLLCMSVSVSPRLCCWCIPQQPLCVFIRPKIFARMHLADVPRIQTLFNARVVAS